MRLVSTLLVTLLTPCLCQAGWLLGPNVRVEHNYYGAAPVAVQQYSLPAYGVHVYSAPRVYSVQRVYAAPSDPVVVKHRVRVRRHTVHTHTVELR